MLIPAFVLGVAAGLRSMTPLAVTAWAAQSWPALQQSSLSFFAAPWTAYLLTLLAVGELIADKLPFIPSRLSAGPLAGRILSGALCGAVVAIAAAQSALTGAVIGAIGGVAGSYGGYYVRRTLTVSRRLPDLAVALGEDAVTIALSLLAVSRL